MSSWYTALCKPRREALAEANLVNQGYRVYLPRLAAMRRRNGAWVDHFEPMFPRYLFLAAGREQQSLAPVRSTFGVSGLVRFGGQPATIPEAVVESLRERERSGVAHARSSPFKAGDTVGFRVGPCAGLEGIYDVEAGEDRVIVLLDFLGKLNNVKVDRDWLVPARGAWARGFGAA